MIVAVIEALMWLGMMASNLWLCLFIVSKSQELSED